MATSKTRRIGLTAVLVVLAGCSGTSATNGGVTSGLTWAVSGTYQPDVVPDPQVVFWTAQVEGVFYNPVLDAGVRSWSTSGTLTITRVPSRQAVDNECTATVSPDSQVITLDDTNTTAVLFLGDDDLVYSGMASTSIVYQDTVTCPNQDTQVTETGDFVPWLEIPQTARTAADVVIDGAGDLDGANRTWTLTKSEN
jgi:hypothetical protein